MKKVTNRFAGLDQSELIEELRRRSKKGLQNAIDRGQILERMELTERDYEEKKPGLTYRAGALLINLATSPRTYRTDITLPAIWRAAYELVKRDLRKPGHPYAVPDRIFEEVFRRRKGDGFSLVGYDSTKRDVMDAIDICRRRFLRSNNEDEEAVKTKTGRSAVPFENQIVFGSCFDLIPKLKDRSINLVLTSPPYLDVMKKHYPGVPEEKSLEWFCTLFKLLDPKMAKDGSVLMIIRSQQQRGRVSPYLLRVRLALEKMGWPERDDYVWIKPDAPGGTGSNNRLRHAHEHILWFAQNRPYISTKAGGNKKGRVGFQSNDPHGIYNNTSTSIETGTARKTDVFEFCVGENEKGIKHPARFPQSLAESLIETFSRVGDIVLDPCIGSGTTALAARALGRSYIGFDVMQKYVNIANRRLENERR